MTFSVNPLVEECKRLRKTLIPMAEKHHGLAQQIAAKNTLYPFVLLLGNHSSGKSSFINHILNRRVQTTGVAPTDDNFTIVGPGDADMDRNGPALVGDPDLGFSDLASFGPVLINHTHLKVRANTNITNFMIVDSPGMIDSPVTENSASSSPIGMDRGYNFEGVCRWYAERADVILLFFDPDKPGTTGETLSILTTALVGLDHKLYILLNKADQFHKIHDFARAYGSLCWNLSKVIPRKDLPRIHTMCVPIKNESEQQERDEGQALKTRRSPSPPAGDDVASSNAAGKLSVESPLSTAAPSRPQSFFEQGFHDLEESRLEIEKETFNAPLRRVDNEITRLTEAVSALLMHCTIVDRALEVYHSKLWRARALTAGTLVASVAVTMGVSYLCDFLLPPADTAIVTSSTSSTGSNSSSASSSAEEAVKTAKVDTGVKLSGAPVRSGGVPDRGGARPVRAPSSPPVIPAASAASTAPVVSAVTAPPIPTPSAYAELWNWRSKFTVVSWTAVLGALSSAGVVLFEHITMTNLLQTFNEKATYESIFRSIYQKEIAANNESTLALGKLVLDALPTSVNSDVIQQMQRVEKVEFTALHRILNEDIANLRRRASPDFPLLSTPDKLSAHSSADELSSILTSPCSSPSAEALERVPYKSARAQEHPDMHVHFSPSTASSPITPRERTQAQRSLRMLVADNAQVAQARADAERTSPHTLSAPDDTTAATDLIPSGPGASAGECSVFQDGEVERGIAYENFRTESPLTIDETAGMV